MKPKELAQFREEKDTFPENGEPKVRQRRVHEDDQESWRQR